MVQHYIGDMAVSSSLPTPGIGPPTSVFDKVGGMDFFVELVDKFYDYVATMEDLIALYPEGRDLTGAKHRLSLFLAQFWGGPTTYSDERGHPRLRRRHMEFHVDDHGVLRWLAAMKAAMDDMAREHDAFNEEIYETLWAYFYQAAPAMRNAEVPEP